MNAWMVRCAEATTSILSALIVAACASRAGSSAEAAVQGPLSTRASEIFLLPPDFRGPVLVVYGNEIGRPGNARDGDFLYSIPPNGVLTTSRAEPQMGTPVRVAFTGTPSTYLRMFEGCDSMRWGLTKEDKNLAVCWLDELGGSNIPEHIAFLVTDWSHIPSDYNRGMFLVDSVLFHGALKGGPQWTEPKKKPTSTRRSAASLD